MKKLFIIGALFFASNANAESYKLDSERLHSCGGKVKLSVSQNGDYHLKIKSHNCKNLVLKDYYGTHLKSYKLQGEQGRYRGSYTLSNKMLRAASYGPIRFTVRSNSGKTQDSFTLSLGRQGRGRDHDRDRRVSHRRLPDGYYFGYNLLLLGECAINDPDGIPVHIPSVDYCANTIFGVTERLPHSWEYGYGTWGDCYLWDQNRNAILSVRKSYCRTR